MVTEALVKEKPPVEKKVDRRSGARLSASLVVWFVAILLLFDLGIGLLLTGKPENTIAHRDKLDNFFNSDLHPDLLLLGSSVALASSYTADKAKGYVAKGVDQSSYLELVDLSQLIFEKTGKRFSGANLSLFGSMASDTWMVAAKTIEFGKAPKVAIYETVSRDLFDASVTPVGESPYYGYLSTIHSKSSFRLLPPFMLSLIDSVMKSKLVLSIMPFFEDDQIFTSMSRVRKSIDSVFCAASNVYGNRVSISSMLSDRAGSFMHRGTTLHNAVLNNQIENKKKNPFAKLAGDAPGTFEVSETPQLLRYEQERVYFAKLLKLCKQKGIKLIVVNMPTREGYKNLIPNGLKDICPHESYKLARQLGFEVIDLDRNLLEDDCYKDLGHLNEKGAVKLNIILADELAKRKLLDDVTPTHNLSVSFGSPK